MNASKSGYLDHHCSYMAVASFNVNVGWSVCPMSLMKSLSSVTRPCGVSHIFKALLMRLPNFRVVFGGRSRSSTNVPVRVCTSPDFKSSSRYVSLDKLSEIER